MLRGGSLYVPGRIGSRTLFHDPLNGETRQRLNCNWRPSTDTCTKQLVITLQTTLIGELGDARLAAALRIRDG